MSSPVIISPIAFEIERLKREIRAVVAAHQGRIGEVTVLAGSSGKVFVLDVENNLEISDEMCDIVSKSRLVDANTIEGEDLPAFYNWDSNRFTKPTSIVSFALK